MRTRRTSIYSLRVPTPDPNAVLEVLSAVFGGAEIPLHDCTEFTEDGQTYAVVGFRAAGDTAAAELSTRLLKRACLAGRPSRLITGYGVHRRTVAL